MGSSHSIIPNVAEMRGTWMKPAFITRVQRNARSPWDQFWSVKVSPKAKDELTPEKSCYRNFQFEPARM